LALIPHASALAIDAAIHHGGEAVVRQNRDDGPHRGRTRHSVRRLRRRVRLGSVTTEAVIAPFRESAGPAISTSSSPPPSCLGRSVPEIPAVRQTELAHQSHGEATRRSRPERRTRHATRERRLDYAQRRENDGENDQRGTHPSRSNDAGETTRTREGIASVGAGAPSSPGAESSVHTTMAVVPSRPESCINFSGERPGLSAYRAWKSARNTRWAYETLGARLRAAKRRALSRKLSANGRVSAIVTDSTQSATRAFLALLTVTVPGRMVATCDQGERMMGSVRNTTEEASVNFRGCHS